MTRSVSPVSDKESRIVTNVRTLSLDIKKVESADPFNVPVKELQGIKPSLKAKVTREIKKTYKGIDDASTTQIELDTSGYNYLDVVQPPHNLESLAQLPFTTPAHFAAIEAKTANIVGLGIKLVESPKTKRRLNSIEDSEKASKLRRKLAQAKDELIDHINSLNDDDSLVETLSRVWFDYESLGVGYIEIGRIQAGPRAGMIGYIGHVPATTMRVRRRRDGYIQITSNKAVYFRNFGENTPNPIADQTKTNEIIMLKKYSTKDSFYGAPPILSAMNAVAGNMFAERFNLDYFENKAVPRHIIILKGAEFSLAAENSIMEFFETGLKGQHHRALFVPLPGDRPDEKVELKIEPVEAGIQDQSFDKYKKNNTSEILLAHRVPPNKIGLTEGMSVATALDASKTFKDQVCVPQQRMLATKVNKIMKEFTDVFVLEFNELTLTDEDTQSKIDERYLRMQVYTPNMVLARQGIPGRKDGDKVVDLKPQQKADIKADAGKTRQEDSDRSAQTSTTAANGRNAKGSGRAD